MTRSSYIDHRWTFRNVHTGFIVRVTHSWAAHTQNNLAWHYGPERAAAMMSGGDARCNIDIAAWNNLGTPRQNTEQKRNVIIDSSSRLGTVIA